ncbi:uncharacterized protein LOC124555454 isoform X1 [Schistocerca americana]|uniref:uncharacterized protein LOC124555454 isoform X1 n=1 Tax=Schistocerca americana TaxID=7009 RepID=UPI001F4F9518|nr:uncharacterized protein LOC124555454 isoform X1 [Schistocerca americana]
MDTATGQGESAVAGVDAIAVQQHRQETAVASADAPTLQEQSEGRAEGSADAPTGQEHIEEPAEASVDATTEQEKHQETAVPSVDAPTGQYAQRVETFINEVAALDQALSDLRASQQKVKRLLAISQAGITGLLLPVANPRGVVGRHIAALPHRRSQQYRVVKAKFDALKEAYYQLRAAEVNGVALAEKVTEDGRAVYGAWGSQEVTAEGDSMTLVKNAIEGLLAVLANSNALVQAVEQFAVPAGAFLSRLRRQSAAFRSHSG